VYRPEKIKPAGAFKYMKISDREAFSFYSHALGAVLAVVGTILLAALSRESTALLLLSIVYGISVTTLFLSSSLYHAHKLEENGESIWRKLDHLAIFVMIAGTYTPMCYLYIQGPWRWGIIIAQWSLVFLGIFFKFFFLRAPRCFSTIIYLAMGWMALLVVGKMINGMQPLELMGLFGGGIFFTIGAVIYILKKPDPLSEYMGFHGLFHIFILLGGLTHFLVVLHGIAKAVGRG
jgi:hemolysin III